MNRIAILACSLLLVTAGCNQITNPGPDAPTVTSSPTPGESSPYVTTGDDLDASVLINDHVLALRQAGTFTHNQTKISYEPNQTVTHDHATREELVMRANVDRDHYFITYRDDSSNGGYVYLTSDGAYIKEVSDTGDPTYYYSGTRTIEHTKKYRDQALGTGDHVDQMSGDTLHQFIAAVNWTVAGTQSYAVSENQTVTVTRLTATDMQNSTDRNFLGGTATITEKSGEMLIGPDGLIYSYRFTVSTPYETTTVIGNYTDVGTTTVERPSWIDKTRDTEQATDTAESESERESRSTPQVDFAFDYSTANGTRTLTIMHDGGDQITVGDDESSVLIKSSVGRSMQWRPTDGDIRAGDTITVGNYTPNATYRVIWVSSDGSTTLTLSKGVAPAQETEQE